MIEENSKKTEWLVGLFVLVGLLLLGGLVLQFGSFQESLKDTYTLEVRFEDGSGLKQGAPVRLGGSKIGKVASKPELNESFNGVIVRLDIFSEVKVPDGSTFAIDQAGMMGDAYIEVTPPVKLTGKVLAQGAVIDGASGGGLEAITNAAERIGVQAQDLLEDVQVAVGDLQEGLKRINEGFLSEKNAEKFSSTLENLDSSLERLEEGFLGEENKDNLGEGIAGIKDAMVDIKAAAATLKEQAENFGTVMEGLPPVVDEAKVAMEQVGAAAEKFGELAEKTSLLVGDVKAGDGLLHALLYDEELKDDFADLIYNLKENGVIFYRDRAGKEEEAAAEKQKASQGGEKKRRWFR